MFVCILSFSCRIYLSKLLYCYGRVNLLRTVDIEGIVKH